MKKTLFKVLIFTCSITFLFSAGGADNSGQATTGIVPFSAQWTVTPKADLETSWTGLTKTEYEANEFIIDDYFALTDIDVNSPFYIKVTRTGWTVPGTYMTAGEKQEADGTNDEDSDILISVGVSNDGYILALAAK